MGKNVDWSGKMADFLNSNGEGRIVMAAKRAKHIHLFNKRVCNDIFRHTPRIWSGEEKKLHGIVSEKNSFKKAHNNTYLWIKWYQQKYLYYSQLI